MEYRNSFRTIKDSRTDHKLWIEMEYCEGGTLSDYVLQKKPSNDIKYRFMLEISSGVAFLHKSGVRHRDLTSSNIVIAIDAGQEHAKVGDFGLAKVASSSSALQEYYESSGSNFGAKYFMPLEVFKGEKYRKKSDIFSMGLIFHAMAPTLSSKEIDGKEVLVAVSSSGEAIGETMKANFKLNDEDKLAGNLMSKDVYRLV